jgi:hypothetical protein
METTVKLSCQSLSVKDKLFEISHAQNLLDVEKRLGFQNWQLTDKNFTLKDGIIERATKGADNEKPVST